ncbi:hypothetical protein Gotur_028179 [Gossypium turneri]
MWNNRYDFLPTHNTILVLELTCDPDYMPWFRIHGKPYLLGEEVRCRHPHTSRPRQPPLNPRGGKVDPSSTPVQEPALMALVAMPSPHPLQFAIGHSSSMWYTPESSHFPMTVTSTMMYRSSMHEAPTESAIIIPSAYRTPHSYDHSLWVTSTSIEGEPQQPQPRLELNLKGIQRITVDHPDVAQVLTIQNKLLNTRHPWSKRPL